MFRMMSIAKPVEKIKCFSGKNKIYATWATTAANAAPDDEWAGPAQDSSGRGVESQAVHESRLLETFVLW